MHVHNTYVLYGTFGLETTFGWFSVFQFSLFFFFFNCWLLPTVHDLSHMAGSLNSCRSSDLSSYFTVGPCLIQCITRSEKVNYGAGGKENVCTTEDQCQLDFWTGAQWTKLSFLFSFPGIAQFHVLVLSLWSMKNDCTPEKASNTFTGSEQFSRTAQSGT